MTKDAVLLGIDLGTTVCKAVAFDVRLRPLAVATRQLPLSTRSGAEIEQDAESWWTASCEVVREALHAAGDVSARVAGLSIASQGITFVPIDPHGDPLAPAISWLDSRAVAQRRMLDEKFGDRRIFSVTGKRCFEGYLLPKLLWFREHHADLYERAAHILMPLDFLLARMTGEYVTDHTMASGTMLYDVTRQEWSRELTEDLGLDVGKLPKIGRAGGAVGRLRAGAADALGLPQSVLVSVGGQDQKVAALGAGIDLERCTVSLGTAMAIIRKSRRPIIDEQMRVPCFSDLLPDRWILEGSSNCCSIFDWARQTLFRGMSLDELNRAADEAADKANPLYFLPYFAGAWSPFFSPGARGSLHGLDLSTTPGQIVRAIYDGIAFVIRANLEVMEEISGPVSELRIFGGGSRSDVWCGIVADVVNRPVVALSSSEAASVGAAILAGKGCGVFSTVEEAFGLEEARASHEPRVARVAAYDGMYEKFNGLSRELFARAED